MHYNILIATEYFNLENIKLNPSINVPSALYNGFINTDYLDRTKVLECNFLNASLFWYELEQKLRKI